MMQKKAMNTSLSPPSVQNVHRRNETSVTCTPIVWNTIWYSNKHTTIYQEACQYFIHAGQPETPHTHHSNSFPNRG
jgi:hypothetical protein